jgi:hypothetical protein
MSLRDLLDCLPGELARLSSAYEVAARPHRSLRPYPTLATLLERLQRKGNRPSKRKALIALLLRVHQTKPHHLWSTVLLHVFTAMIKKLRKQLVVGDDDTREGILVEAFQEALLRVPTDDSPRIFMYVSQALRRRAFKALAEVIAWEEVGFGTDSDLEPDPSTVYETPLIGVWLEGHGTRPEQAELLATLVDRGGLRAMVRRRHPHMNAAEQTRSGVSSSGDDAWSPGSATSSARRRPTRTSLTPTSTSRRARPTVRLRTRTVASSISVCATTR